MGAIDASRTFAARYHWLVLAVAAVSAFFRLGAELVGVAEESLFANTALEIVQSGEWVGTTLLGRLDYYNSKPPLQVWLVALSFKSLGIGLVPLRLPSAMAAWLSVLVLMLWSRRAFGPGVAVWAGLVLATSQGFFWVHSGRSANADAVLALLVLLAVVTIWAGMRRPWWRAWLGPILAGIFLTKGFAVAMPAALVAVMAVVAWRDRTWRGWPAAVAVVTAALPVAAWGWARWRVDEWRFFEALWSQDVVTRTTRSLEGHGEPWWYYLYVLQRNHPEWIVAAVAALVLLPRPWLWWREQLSLRRGDTSTKALLAAWAAATFVVPSMMATKVAWYINPFLPLFALGIGWVLDSALNAAPPMAGGARRAVLLAGMIVLAVAAAEARVWWQSYVRLDAGRSAQGLLLAEGRRLQGRDVFRERWGYPEVFLVRAHGARERVAPDAAAFLRSSRAGDYLLSEVSAAVPGLVVVGTVGGEALYRRTTSATP